MNLLIAMLVIPAVIATYLTGVFCRRSISRGRQPSFVPAVIATFCAPLVIILASERSALFTTRYWQGDSTGRPAPYFLLFVGACIVISILPCLGVVFWYRRKTKR